MLDKRLVFCVLLAVFGSGWAFACGGTNKSHHAFFGSRKHGDELLHMDHPKVQASMLRVESYDVLYPTVHDTPGTITYIEVLDQFRDKNGGCASILEGGVGSDHVKIHLKSKRGYGLDFIIKIFGFRKYSG